MGGKTNNWLNRTTVGAVNGRPIEPYPPTINQPKLFNCRKANNMDQKLLLKLIELATQLEGKSVCEENGTFKIVILQRGWIYVGKYYEEGNNCRLEEAACLRTWGTKKGLGELAENGPTSDTILDACPTVRFHKLGIVAMIDVNNTKKWKY